MALVPVERLQPGSVLSQEVHDRNGRLLMPRGQALLERHLLALRMWGITHCEIEGAAPEPPVATTLDPAVLEEAGRVVERLFSLQSTEDDHPLLARLRELSLERVAAELAAAGEDP